MNTAPAEHPTERADGLVRLLSVAFRRYSREPESRALSARLMVLYSIALYAGETTAGEAALLASEGIAELAVQERKRGAR